MNKQSRLIRRAGRLFGIFLATLPVMLWLTAAVPAQEPASPAASVPTTAAPAVSAPGAPQFCNRGAQRSHAGEFSSRRIAPHNCGACGRT